MTNLSKEGYVGKVAFSKYFGCYIRCVEYTDDTHWKFVHCTRDGVSGDILPMQAQSDITLFIWRRVAWARI